MEEPVHAPNVLLARYRGREAFVPTATSLDTLRLQIAHRVKPGLLRLLKVTRQNRIAYAGYALPGFRLPAPESPQAEDLDEESVRPDPAKKDRKMRDNLWVNHTDCFDRMLAPRRTAVWRQDLGEENGGLKATGFLLGPVVRGPAHPSVDRFGQNSDTDFDHGSAVFVAGRLVVQGLSEHDSSIRDGWPISTKDIAKYFAESFDMRSLH